MNRLAILIALILMLFSSARVDAFYDIFVTYGPRNNKINNIILEAFETPTEKWTRISPPAGHEYSRSASYTLENEDRKNPSKLFVFTELDYTKHPDIKNFEDYLNYLTNVHKYRKMNVLSKDNRSLYFEVLTSEEGSEEFRLHKVEWVVDLGGNKYRSYSYGIEKRYLNPEEKKFLIELFKYMETQIGNIPA